MSGANPPVGGGGPQGMVMNLVRQVAPPVGGRTSQDFSALNKMPAAPSPVSSQPAVGQPGVMQSLPQGQDPSVIAKFLNPSGSYKGR